MEEFEDVEIKRCPFCGSTNLEEKKADVVEGVVFRWIECVSCNATGPKSVTLEDAIQCWNRRADDDI